MKFKLLLIVLLGLFASNLEAQEVCTGSLGENIFEDGDFGSGVPNVPQQNPNIAPGYTYTRNPPPNDGFYTITNNTGEWGNIFGSWIRIRDNSNDPNGYMMVVNASFDPGVFYEKTITGLCEGTLYEFSADIINIVGRNVGGHIAPNVSFFLDGAERFSTGNIPQNETWNTYGFTFTTPPGVTEMTLTLRNNAPGGIGNDLALDNITFRACGPTAFVNTEQNIFLCADDNTPETLTADIDVATFAIQWQISRDNGVTWNSIPNENGRQFIHNDFSVGSYQYRYLSAGSEVNLSNFKCRVISDVVTLEVLPLFYDFRDTICEGIPYQFGNQLLTQTGSFTETFISTRGCDSIVTLGLTVLTDELMLDLNASPPSCPNDSNGSIEVINVNNAFEPVSYFFNGAPVNTNVYDNLNAGTYLISVTDRYGCNATNEVALALPDPFEIELIDTLRLEFGVLSDPVNVIGNKIIDQISWSPEEFLTCNDCSSPQITGVGDISYTVSVVDINGCEVSDSLLVFVDKSEPRVFIPNAFSPNDDGVNDFFFVNAFGQIVQEVIVLRIFDRWGGLVFERLNGLPNLPEEGWNGRLQGEIVEEGVYIYQYELLLLDGTTLKKSGTITLIR